MASSDVDSQPDAETVYMQKAAKIMREVTIPDISSAAILNCSNDGKQYTIATKWSQKNYTINKSDSFSVVYNYDCSEKKLTRLSPPLEANKVLVEAVSPSLKLRAVIKKHVEEKSTKEQYILELWSLTRRLKTINLSSLEKHGQVHSDALFGALCWSQDETKLVYVAEKKKAKATGYFDSASSTPSSNSTSDKPVPGDKFNYEESWGEQLTDVVNTVLCVYSLSDDSVHVFEGLDDDLCPLQPSFGASSNTLLFSALKKSPFRLGAIYCENRQCGIYMANLQEGGEITEISSSKNITANYHPYINKSGTKLVYIQRQLSGTGDPHRGSISVMIYDFNDKTNKLLTNELKSDGKTFSLFVMGKNVSFNIWLPDDTHIVLPNTLEGRNYICVIDTETAMLKSMIECTNFLGMHEGIFLASFNALNSENVSLMVVDFTDPPNPAVMKDPLKIDDDLETDSIIDEHGIVSFYVMPKTVSGTLPLFVTPHGGPHSTFMKYYSRNARLFCKLGYAVLLVNYRGSTGFTNESLKSLPGNVGTQDVNDCQAIVNQFIKLKKGSIDTENVFICGGSHGGFLGAHLVGQFPDFYKAACLRNPVIEISSMSVQSDIPDWTYFESGLKYTQDRIISKEESASMITKSPVQYVPNIKAPVLLCIGGKDARVPPDQGKYYFRMLKANNKVAKLLYYPNDCHPLMTVETDGDNTLNICKWFYQHGTHSR